mgnify:CR=1 FL=1
MRGCNDAPADKQRNSIASNTQHQPLAGKDSAGVTKTLAEL